MAVRQSGTNYHQSIIHQLLSIKDHQNKQRHCSTSAVRLLSIVDPVSGPLAGKSAQRSSGFAVKASTGLVPNNPQAAISASLFWIDRLSSVVKESPK